MTWTLELTRLPLSGNKRDRSHWAVKNKELRELVTEIGWLARAAKIPEATGKRYVRIELHKKRGVRPDDEGNIDARSKGILDALTRLCLLIDDDPTHLEYLGVHEGEHRNPPGTTILIGDA